MQLVEQLTGYVSDALAEGSLANEELHYVFQLTTQLGKVIEGTQSDATDPQAWSPANVAGPQVHNSGGLSPSADRQSRTTSDLLNWAGNSDASDGSLTGNASISENALDEPALVDVLAHIAEGPHATEVTSMQAAAEALLKAARHNQKTGRRKATASRYMDDGSSRLVTTLHATASGSLEAEGHWEVGVPVGKQHATPGHQQGLQATVSSMVPAHLRLHQLSETWRSHKDQLRLQQQEKEARAASPTPPARLTSQARQRAADRLYAHAVQRQIRQQAAREEQACQGSPPGSPTLHAPRNAQGFFQRQQDLLVRRQWWAEQQRPRDEESLQHCTGRPLISDFAHSLRRSRDDLLAWNARKEERVKQLRIQQALQDSEEVTLTPRINPASRHMALRLAHRAAQQDPHLLTVIQSQPEGWVLGDRPAPAHRSSTQGSNAIGKGKGLQQPAWVKARATTSMRVLQRAADKGLSASPPPSSWLGSQGGHSVGSAAFEEAPWMGHGGVRHMDAGHLEASLKRCETHSGHSSGVATPSPRRPTGAHHASEMQVGGQNASGHKLVAQGSQAAAPHPGQLAATQGQLEGAFHPEAAALAATGHAVDPIEKSAPAWGLDPTAPPTHPSPPTPAQPDSARHSDSSSHAPAQSACVTKSEPAASVLPWLDQSHAALLTEQKPVSGQRHSLSSAIAAGPAVQARSPLGPAAQPESAVDSSLKSSEPVASVRQVGTGSQAAGAGVDWQGFASVDEGPDDGSNADWNDDHTATGTCQQDKSSAYKVDAVAEAPRLSDQGSSGLDVVSGLLIPDLIGLPADKAVKAKQPSGEPSGERRSSGEPSAERRSSGVGGRGPLHDALGSGGYAASSRAAAYVRRNSEQQRVQPSMQIPVPSPNMSGKALRAKALKAAAEAAAKATRMPSRPIASAKAAHSDAGRTTADASEAAGAEAMTQFSIAAEHAEQGRSGGKEVVSMHSVMKHKPAPLIPKRQPPSLDMRAYSAAIEHMLAVKDSGPSPAVRTYSRQARSSAEKNKNAMAAASPDVAARRLFNPAATDSTGYRKKHGKRIESANMLQ
ncbi:TPA: hypothetical protein ACH3X1_014977 [Trebouxia sp. C0004]